jgi:hypothetical protein
MKTMLHKTIHFDFISKRSTSKASCYLCFLLATLPLRDWNGSTGFDTRKLKHAVFPENVFICIVAMSFIFEKPSNELAATLLLNFDGIKKLGVRAVGTWAAIPSSSRARASRVERVESSKLGQSSAVHIAIFEKGAPPKSLCTERRY